MPAVRSQTSIPTGPVDFRVIRILEQRYGKSPDLSFLRQVEGGEVSISAGASFLDARGQMHRLGRLLPWIDNHSELRGPFQRSPECPGRDRRIDWGVLTLLEEESPTALSLFCGERLIPFASLYCGNRHPDELRLGDAEANLLVFDYGEKLDRPAVVVWLAKEAMESYEQWSGALQVGVRQQVPYRDFIVPVSQTFDEFARRLTGTTLGAENRRDQRGG